MPNPDFSEIKSGRKGRGESPPPTGKRAGKTAAFPVKPAFKTGSFGKSQPKDRSGGVDRAKVYPNSEGL